VGAQVQRMSRALLLQSVRHICRQVPCVVHGHSGLSLSVCVCVYLTWTCRSGRASAAKDSCVIFVIISP
jgi:hypothetical protein